MCGKHIIRLISSSSLQKCVISCDLNAMGGLGTRSEWHVVTDRVVKVVKDGVTEEGDELKWEELKEILDEVQFESQV